MFELNFEQLCIQPFKIGKTLFQKKQAPHVHAHNPQHTYAHFAHLDHTHSHVPVRVYKCTHCDHKGHLVKFCYDRVRSINFANQNIWVSNNANPRGPKRKWVPKSPPLVFNVGVGSHMT